MTHGAPGSLVGVRRLAPLLMAATGLVTIAESLFVKGGEGLLFGLAMFAIPTVGTTLLGKFLSEQRWGWGVTSALAAAVVHVLLALAVGGHDGELAMLCALVVDGVTLGLALPALIACTVLGKRRDLDAGDTLLGFGGIWFVAVQVGKLVLMPAPAFLVGLALGLAAVGVCVQRALGRRAWCAKVRSGAVSGWRVREDPEGDATLGLVPLYGGLRANAVLEQYEEHPGPYRGVLLARPVAAVPAR